MTTRIFGAFGGTWLAITAFMWPHGMAGKILTFLCGILVAVLALVSIYERRAAYLNAALAVVLFAATMLFADGAYATFWNNSVVAIAIFGAALMDGGPDAVRRERELYGRT